MIRLTLLGGLDLIGADDQPVEAVLRQPKRLALLVYLASGKQGTFRSRDRALLLFWPDANEEQARSALNQTVHFLRRSLGSRIVVTRGPGELGISADALWCDVTAFEQALERGDLEQALTLYRGDLLPGFAIDAGPEFEHWLDEWRTRLRRQAAAGAWGLSEAAERGGDGPAAAEWARRAVDLSLNDEIALQRRLRLLERLGDHAGAIDAYERFAAQLTMEYRATPSAGTEEIVAGIRSRGRRAQAESGHARSVTSSAAAATEELPAAVAHSPIQRLAAIPQGRGEPTLGTRVTIGSPTSVVKRVSLGTIAVIVCLSILLVLSHRYRQPGPGITPGSMRIAVMPLTNVGTGPGTTNVSAALTSAIVDQLARARSLEVTSSPPTQGATRARLSGRQPAAQLILTGGVLQFGSRIRVDIQLGDPASGRAIKTAVYESESRDPLALVDSLSRQIAILVRTAAGRESRLREWRAWASSQQAYELMQQAAEDADRAVQLERSGDLATAVRALQGVDSTLRLVALLAPGWSEPWIERAETSRSLAALYLTPTLRDSARLEALLRKGIQEADHAVSLHPSDPSALEALGSTYYWFWLVARLPPDSAARLLARAEHALRSAVGADPSRASSWNRLSAAQYMRADYSGAYLAESHAYDTDTYLQHSEEILNGLFLTGYEIGDDAGAAQWCGEINRRFARGWTGPYCRLALLAWTAAGDTTSVSAAWRTASEAALPIPQFQPVLHMLVATVIARHAMRDSAEAVIRRARQRDPENPELLPLEADARIALGQRGAASALLAQYLRGKPSHRVGVVRSRRFAVLRHPQVPTQPGSRLTRVR